MLLWHADGDSFLPGLVLAGRQESMGEGASSEALERFVLPFSALRLVAECQTV
jgi:hypothetical protein